MISQAMVDDSLLSGKEMVNAMAHINVLIIHHDTCYMVHGLNWFSESQ